MDQLDLQEFMAKVQGKPGAEVMNMMLLRSMQQARYSEHNHGHYGLAALVQSVVTQTSWFTE